MWVRVGQILLAILCSSLFQEVIAVVNNPTKKNDEESVLKVESSKSNTSIEIDSKVSSANEKSNNRREAPADTYGPPVGSSYFPTGGSHLNLPVPVYGVPNGPTNNLVYPAAPPVAVPLPTYGAPSPVYGLPVSNHFPTSGNYLSSFSFGGLKTQSHYKGSPGKLRFQYGPPGKPYFGKHSTYVPYKSSKFGKPSANTYAFTSGFKDTYKPSNLNFNFNSGNGFMTQANVGSFGGLSAQYGPPVYNVQSHIVNVPTSDISHSHLGVSAEYGVPEIPTPVYGIPEVHKPVYGPPSISPRPRPPHPGIPAPPTPPDIKYDGWQPILGLISKPPQNSYLPPQGQDTANHHIPQGDIGHQHIPHEDLSNQRIPHDGLGALALDKFHKSGVKDSYGAPLNTVTGSGGVVMATGNDYAKERPHDEEDNHGGGNNDLNIEGLVSSLGLGQDIQAVKSIGYELFPGSTVITGQGSADTYSVPPPNSYSPQGHYAAGNSYHGGTGPSPHFFHGLSVSHNGAGLVPPSGLYGVPPGGRYGTPLMFHGPKHHPRIPQKHTSLTSFVPPAISIAKPFKEYGPPSTNSLPPIHSFQTVNNALPSSDFNLHIGDAVASTLTSYNAPSGVLDNSYAPSQHTDLVGLDFSLPGATVDLTNAYDSLTASSNLNSVSDCNHKHYIYNEDSVPAFSKNSVEAIEPLDSSISYNVTESDEDQNGAQSQQQNTEVRINLLEQEHSDNAYAKSVAENLLPNSELLKSQPIDITNLPVNRTSTSYTVQIQSSDGKTPHGDVLNEELLQSILAAIEQPSKGKPIVQDS
ncbi:unnamed protein product [Acanthoscelides obtectus]|uniref:Uncharacterized protein n=1 Tax=Acanthoscelides obtectus TaxID=200917 RepID=A0A9P0PCY1_ACAOB|nr:unnamed protein product [Acanthoscelides obtectus]CAK1628294.1 hypothetical protein AOBTE_LOCUS5115 [Acanthoscelides obtectus]